MDVLDLNAVVHFDTSDIDEAIEKANRLLALLMEAKKAAGSQNRES